jgi:predicted transcriptional regulator
MVGMASSVITTRLDPETLALVDRVSKAQGRSRSWFAAKAIKRAAEAEAELQAFIQEGIVSAANDPLIDGDVVLAKLDRWIAELESKIP